VVENQLNGRGVQGGSLSGRAPGEKPVINEIFEPDDFSRPWKREAPKKTSEPQQEIETPTTEKESPDSLSLVEGVRLFCKKRWEEALRELLRVSGDNVSDDEQAELAYYLGLCYAKLERYDEAPLYLEQVIGSGGDPLRVYQCRMTLAYIYIMTDRASMAETELEHLQANGLESVMLYNTMAYAVYAQKRYLGAIDFYEKALEIDSDNTTALNSLGYILADVGLDKLKGLRLCRKAVEKKSENAAYLDSLGWACYKCGKLKEARSWLRRAMDIAPQEKEIREHFRVVTVAAGAAGEVV
jgi:tetratricopeptide (TPR) repeat protein